MYGGGYDWFINEALLGPVFGFVVLLTLWAAFWKGLALWHAARREQPWWFVIILVVNTAGVLEIVYLFFIAKLKVNQLFNRREPHMPHGHHTN